MFWNMEYSRFLRNKPLLRDLLKGLMFGMSIYVLFYIISKILIIFGTKYQVFVYKYIHKNNNKKVWILWF